MKRALLLCALLPACGSQEVPVSRPATVPVALNEYVWRFEQEWGHQVTGVDVRFVPDVQQLPGADERTIGQCSPFFDFMQVSLDAAWWKDASADCREVLIFHELSHCALGRGHDETMIDGRPSSVMFPDVSPCRHWEHRAAYMDELFGRNTP